MEDDNFDPFMYHNSFYDPFNAYMPVDIPNWKHIGDEPVEYPIDPETVKAKLIDNLRLVHDPEIPINIYDLGLIYGIDVDDQGAIKIILTLTTPNCPSAQELPEVVKMAAMVLPETSIVQLDLTFDPPWTPQAMSEEAKLIMVAEYGMDMDKTDD